MDRTAAPSERILAIVSGASHWPHYPGCEGGPTFRDSAEAVIDYLRDPDGLGLPAANVKWLFDSYDAASQITEAMEQFVTARRRQLEAQGTAATDLLLYHVGHGDLSRRGDEFFLPVRATRQANAVGSSIRAADLATLADEAAHGLRTYIVLDCCYAAAAHGAFMSGGVAGLAARKLSEALEDHVDREAEAEGRLPEFGTALLCAAGARDVARALPGERYTMFTGALLAVLREGDPRAPARVSLDDLQWLIRERIGREHGEGGVMPELHVPRQRKGRVDQVPLFPNPARRTEEATPAAAPPQATAPRSGDGLAAATSPTPPPAAVESSLGAAPRVDTSPPSPSSVPGRPRRLWLGLGSAAALVAVIAFGLFVTDVVQRRLRPATDAAAALSPCPDWIAASTFGEIELAAGFLPDPYVRDIATSGGADLGACFGSNGWRGSVAPAPDVELVWTGSSARLTIAATASGDAVLLVNAPDRQWHYADDVNGTDPAITFANPMAGRYDVWIGHFGSGSGISGQLTFSER